MKASKFTDAQKALILKKGANAHPVAEICRKAGISEAAYFNWKKKYDGLGGRSRLPSVLPDVAGKTPEGWLSP